jgi:hypothetical protein
MRLEGSRMLVALCAVAGWTAPTGAFPQRDATRRALPPSALAAQQNASTNRQAATTATSDQASVQLKLPEGEIWLGTVRLPVRVMADGRPLPAGTYRVRLTGEHATDDKAVGQSGQLERWVEFVQGDQVKGRALAPVVPSAEARQVADTALPARGTVRVERLKEDNYYRLWFNYRGDQVLIYLPTA